MKKLIFLFLSVMMTLMLTSCINTEKSPTLISYYDYPTRLCVIKNTGGSSYKDLTVTLSVTLTDRSQEKIKVNIGELKKGKEYFYDVSESQIINPNDIRMVYISSYTFFDYVEAVGQIVIFVILLILIVSVSFAMKYDIAKNKKKK